MLTIGLATKGMEAHGLGGSGEMLVPVATQDADWSMNPTAHKDRQVTHSA